MSHRPKVAHTEKTTGFPGSSHALSDSDDLPNLDARLHRLSQRTLPRSPYLLTVPSDKPYHISSQQADNWRIGSPFDVNEEKLQYMTFLSRNWEDSLLVAVGGWDDEQGGIMETGTATADGLATRANTPQQGTTQKKKITLSAYKNKARAGDGQKPVSKVPDVKRVENQNPNVNGKSLNTEKAAVSQPLQENEKKR